MIWRAQFTRRDDRVRAMKVLGCRPIVIKVAVDRKRISCDSFYRHLIEMDAGFFFRKVSDQLHCPSEFASHADEGGLIRVHLIKHIVNLQL